MNTGNMSNDEVNVICNFIEQVNNLHMKGELPLKLKSPIQQMIEYLQNDCQQTITTQWHINKAKELLEEEQQQITFAFDCGKSRAYATADGECDVKFGFQFYNETYT